MAGKRNRPKADVQPSKPPPNAVFAANMQQLAYVLGRSRSIVAEYQAQGGPAKTQHGYDVREWVQFVYGGKGGADEDKELQRRARRVSIEMDEMKLARMRGDMIPRQEAEQREAKILRWCISVMERAEVEVPRLVRAGMKRLAIGREVADYFRKVRNGAAEQAKKRSK